MDTLLDTPREGRLSFLEISTVSELLICSTPPSAPGKTLEISTFQGLFVLITLWGAKIYQTCKAVMRAQGKDTKATIDALLVI